MMQKLNRRTLVRPGLLAWAVCLAAPYVLSATWLFIATLFAMYALVALSQDIVLGRAGMFDMGHAVYFGIGAYATGILSTAFAWPVLATWPIAALVAVLCAMALAVPIVKLRGDYLLVATLGLNAIFVLALDNNLLGVTGGADGIFGIGAPAILGRACISAPSQFWLCWSVLGIGLYLMWRLDRSHLGRTLRLIKTDELAATTLGVNARHYKVLAFGLGAGLASVAGALFASVMGNVSPGSFNFAESVTLFAIVLVGGQGSVAGVLLGTVLMFVVPQAFRQFETYRYLVFGVAMMVAMVARPEGIWPRRAVQET
ncbi:branched-chain amino acid ABC transporter permease [Thiomonas sp. FB-Cd]|uniref:branched-chain amino acid ABC transporter permease n=1 Tax=Thiomonas sp. FB-Cd TaxID=1158292 RepID=UPI000A75A0D3|nr:branched-chain amino acid ABC transporter permease [Thiomonas sp. FB-Cd]